MMDKGLQGSAAWLAAPPANRFGLENHTPGQATGIAFGYCRLETTASAGKT